MAAVLIFAIVFLAWAVPARAQIYTWRDANGILVLSNRQQPVSAPVASYTVPRTTAIRATRSAPPGRSGRYDDLIEEHARRHGVRSDLVRAVVQVESAFNPTARSPKGALGLMQLMPATIHRFGVRNPFDPSENIAAGVTYLRQLLDRFGDKEELALAAYNAGPEAVTRYGRTVPPYRETQKYVANVAQLTSPAEPSPEAPPVEAERGRIYRVAEVIDGRAVVRYTDQRPLSGSYDVVSR